MFGGHGGVGRMLLGVFMKHFFKAMFLLNIGLISAGAFFIVRYGESACLEQYGVTPAIIYSSSTVLILNVAICVFYFSLFRVTGRLPLGKIGVTHLLVAMFITVLVASPFFKGTINCPARLMQYGSAVIFIEFVILEQVFLFCFFATMVAFSCTVRRMRGSF
ncbi:hypothetical protein [Chromobacterium haemolyticum]|uniref:hypothetical protein n=1 Tax=Chromobacterium haemolyticum TaxID=394935 RepID=UPI0017467BE6|nr:hypothetical protein [Chromobacterium haemolyticum]QOD84270.1 hypothetical protein IEZ30_07290 [Chromobacterium haemolyticum]